MADSNKPDEQALRKLEDVRRALGPRAGVSDLNQSRASARDISVTGPRSISNIVQQIERSSTLWRAPTAFEQIQTALRIPDYTTTLAANSIAINSVTRSLLAGTSAIDAFTKSIEESSIRWRRTMDRIEASLAKKNFPQTAIEKASRSVFVWETGISESIRKFTDTNLFSVRTDLCIRMLEPSRVLSRFAEETLSRIEETRDTRTLRALNASLAVVDAQHLANVDALCSFASNVDDTDVISLPRDLNSPFVQQAELLELPEIENEDDVENLVLRLPAATASEKSRSVLRLTMTCNKASGLKGNGDIFKPTTKVMEVFTDLPWLTPQDETSFGEFIDGLYFVLYEGAGKDKLKFLAEHGGPLDKNDCQVVWCIKHLRNKWLRHDVDHGRNSEVQKSWRDLNSHFQWLGFTGYPHGPEDFRKLHMRLLSEVETFLEKLAKGFG